MKKEINSRIRLVTEKDNDAIKKLVEEGAYFHQHLDWRSPTGLIGYQPYLLLENFPFTNNHHHLANSPVAALACPEEPLGVAWIRIFVVSDRVNSSEAWEKLWNKAQEQLIKYGFSGVIASIPIQSWFRNIIEKSNFCHTHDVVSLFWVKKNIINKQERSGFKIRPMSKDDLASVQSVDQTAFLPLWRYTLSTLNLGLQKTLYSTVIEADKVIIGYQITTETQNTGCHLARLAVLPEYQGRGIGYLLVQDMLNHLIPLGYPQVTVNTQHNNLASLALYDKMGFRHTGDRYPVYELLI